MIFKIGQTVMVAPIASPQNGVLAGICTKSPHTIAEVSDDGGFKDHYPGCNEGFDCPCVPVPKHQIIRLKDDPEGGRWIPAHNFVPCEDGQKS